MPQRMVNRAQVSSYGRFRLRTFFVNTKQKAMLTKEDLVSIAARPRGECA